jgi:hypothetical protein
LPKWSNNTRLIGNTQKTCALRELATLVR